MVCVDFHLKKIKIIQIDTLVQTLPVFSGEISFNHL